MLSKLLSRSKTVHGITQTLLEIPGPGSPWLAIGHPIVNFQDATKRLVNILQQFNETFRIYILYSTYKFRIFRILLSNSLEHEKPTPALIKVILLASLKQLPTYAKCGHCGHGCDFVDNINLITILFTDSKIQSGSVGRRRCREDGFGFAIHDFRVYEHLRCKSRFVVFFLSKMHVSFVTVMSLITEILGRALALKIEKMLLIANFL